MYTKQPGHFDPAELEVFRKQAETEKKAAMFPRQSGFRGRTPLLSLLIHGKLET